jgi:biopolymer transport protein ExbD
MEAASPEFVVPPVAAELGPVPGHQDTRNVWESDLGDWEEHPAFVHAPRRTAKDEADMTSMVDVTFLLLVFFMITASFSVTKALITQPPSAEEGAASAAPSPMTMDELAEASVIVEIGADDSIRVDDVPVAGPVELGDILAAKIGNEKKTEMVIEAEYRATHGMVVAVTDVAMQAGMQRVRRVSRPEQQ